LGEGGRLALPAPLEPLDLGQGGFPLGRDLSQLGSEARHLLLQRRVL
jgi:hypothetical protein